MAELIHEEPGWKPPEWVAVRPSSAYFKAEGMGGDECRAWVLATMRACMTGTREAGSDADLLLRECAERFAKKSEAGKRGMAVRYGKAEGSKPNGDITPLGERYNYNTTRHQHDTNTTQQENKTATPTQDQHQHEPPPSPVGVGVGGAFEGGGGGVGGVVGRALAGMATAPGRMAPVAWFMEEPKERVWELDDKHLPMAAARYCRSQDVELSAKAFRKVCMVLGATAFRRELGTFISEGEAGDLDTARDWGKVFFSRLKKLTPNAGG